MKPKKDLNGVILILTNNNIAGFVKLHRKILDWEWYDDPKTFKLFMHLILTVNIKSSTWHGIEIPAGSRVFSYRKLANELLFTEREIRTHINRLIKTHTVTQYSTPNYSVITVVNWDLYQFNRHSERQTEDTQSDTRPTQQRHTTDNRIRINKNIRSKEDKEKYARAREDLLSEPTFEEIVLEEEREKKRRLRE